MTIDYIDYIALGLQPGKVITVAFSHVNIKIVKS